MLTPLNRGTLRSASSISLRVRLLVRWCDVSSPGRKFPLAKEKAAKAERRSTKIQIILTSLRPTGTSERDMNLLKSILGWSENAAPKLQAEGTFYIEKAGTWTCLYVFLFHKLACM